ncbi:MAG TPA: hypothetical protein VMW52_07925 [Phycisphaerae bacterium]|nr:hypothetical protein [Phycisphaerae bacterium]
MAKQTKRPPVDQVEAPKSRCRKCGSTERERYFRVKVQVYAGTDPQGRPFTHILRRWTHCKQCRQLRVDRALENRAEAESPAAEGPPEK